MKKRRLSNRFYYFFVSFILTFSFLSVFLSMYVSYTNTRELGFGDIRRPVDLYQRVDGNYVFVFGDKSTVIDTNSIKKALVWREKE